MLHFIVQDDYCLAKNKCSILSARRGNEMTIYDMFLMLTNEEKDVIAHLIETLKADGSERQPFPDPAGRDHKTP